MTRADMPASLDEIDRIRAFNRFYTGRLGLLNRSYLESGLPLAEVRVLYELAESGPATARALAQGLGLDEGYLSRIVRRFRDRGWLTRQPDPTDARQQLLSLTPAGETAFGPLRARSRADVAERIANLDPAGRAALCRALEAAEHVLERAPLSEPVLRDLKPGDAGWIISRHGALYARDEGFDHSFEALVAEILAAFLRDHDPERERGWIAEAEGRRLGSIFVVRLDEETAKLRLFLVEPEARGTGLAKRMLTTCMDWSRASGYRRMTLWTHESHRAACALYERMGFRLTAAQATRSFGQDVVEQTWEIDL